MDAPADLDKPAELRPPRPSTTSEVRALQIAALFAAGAILWVARPVAIGVLLGALTAFSLLPVYLRLCGAMKRRALAALTCVGLVALGIAGFLAGFGYLLIGRGIGLVRELGTLLLPGGAARLAIEHWNGRLPRLARLDLHPASIAERIGSAAAEISVRMASIASLVAGTTFSGLLALFFLLVTCYFVLQDWSSLTRRAELMLPLNPRDTRALFDELRRTGRTVLLGTLLTGIAQGVLAGLGYLVTGVPEAAFFGALTGVASLLPGFGTLLVWVPAGIYLLLTDHAVLGIVELLYGALVVVGFSDYVLRPRLVGRHGDGPPLLTLIALFGGLEAFGLIGLVIGPVVVFVSLSLLRIYEREAMSRRAAEDAAGTG